MASLAWIALHLCSRCTNVALEMVLHDTAVFPEILLARRFSKVISAW